MRVCRVDVGKVSAFCRGCIIICVCVCVVPDDDTCYGRQSLKTAE